MFLDQRPVETPSASAIRIVEDDAIAAAAGQRLATDAERRPDFAARRQVPAELADIVAIFVTVQLNGVKVEQRRDVADGGERRIAEDADGKDAGLARKTGQRRGFVCRDMAGAARHEDEAGERRWPGGAQISAAVQSAQLDPSED